MDHGREKKLLCFLNRSIFTEIREFATFVFLEVGYELWCIGGILH